MEKSTTQTLIAGERIAEALDLSEDDRLAANAYEASKATMTSETVAKLAPRKRDATFALYSTYVEPEEHVLKVVQKIPAASLSDALLVLPFAKVVSMLEHLDYWAQRVS